MFFYAQSISAYMGKRLSGKVLATFVRGNLVYGDEKHAPRACGVPILAKETPFLAKGTAAVSESRPQALA